MAKPIVFVSSTVHDLRDMRSAIRYWLEELGYEVLLNETAGFPVAGDRNSYEACLEAVRNSDYCVVLIGNRAGGMYDADTGVTITRQEYREAYQHFLDHGKPRLLVLVRGEVWTLYQIRHELVGRDLGHVLAAKDVKPVFGFIEEVTHADDMRAGASDAARRPAYNWVHTFNSFWRDR